MYVCMYNIILKSRQPGLMTQTCTPNYIGSCVQEVSQLHILPGVYSEFKVSLGIFMLRTCLTTKRERTKGSTAQWEQTYLAESGSMFSAQHHKTKIIHKLICKLIVY